MRKVDVNGEQNGKAGKRAFEEEEIENGSRPFDDTTCFSEPVSRPDCQLRVTLNYRGRMGLRLHILFN